MVDRMNWMPEQDTQPVARPPRAVEFLGIHSEHNQQHRRFMARECNIERKQDRLDALYLNGKMSDEAYDAACAALDE